MNRRNRISFKACPKCRGDLYLDEDAYGVFNKCLQCGRIFEMRAIQLKPEVLGPDKLAA